LNAAIKHNIKKVVLTSSVVAINSGLITSNSVFSEKDWSDTNKCNAYEKSKTLAERKAWEIVEKNPGKLNLTCINPCYV